MEQNNSFIKGMNSDLSPLNTPEESYLSAFNAVYHNQFLYNNSISNEAGFKNIVVNHELVKDLLILGLVAFENDFIVLSIRINSYIDAIQQGLIVGGLDGFIINPSVYNDGNIQEALSSELGRFRRNFDLTYTYEVIINDKDSQYWRGGVRDVEQLWDFAATHQIDAVARRDASNSLIVYWTDGLRKPRRVVITDENDVTTSYVDYFRNLAKQTNLLSEYAYPIVEYIEQIESGNLSTGVYQFAARYLNETLDPTDFGYVSPQVPVVDDFRYEGRANYDGQDPNGPKVEKSIRLRINNVDTDYDFIQLVVIYQDPNNFTKQVKTTQTVRIPKNTNTDLTSIDYIFDGTLAEGIDQNISLDDVLFRSPRYNSAQHIAQKDGRLFLANLTQVVRPDLQYIANRLRLKYQVEHILVSDDSSFFGDYKEEGNTFYKKGYMREEVYSFAIVGVFDDGTISDAFHIPGYVPSADQLTTETNNNSSTTSYIITNYGITEPEFGYLGSYVSMETYANGGFSSGDQTADLNGQRIRHHVIPSTAESPHIITLPNGDSMISILGIVVEGLEEALQTNGPDAVTTEYVKKHLVQCVLVRELRDRRSNKRVISQGCLNTLTKQKGRSINEPTEFQVDYKIGKHPVPSVAMDAVLNLFTLILNPLYSVGLSNINLNGRIKPYNIAPTYALDPFWGDTNFSRTTVPSLAPIIFDNGEQIEVGINSNFAFYSPEENFLLDFRVPNNSYVKNVMTCRGSVNRVINTRIEPNQIFLDGSYSNSLKYPYYKKYRGAYYQLHAEFDSYRLSARPQTKFIRTFKRTKYNDVVVSNENLNELYTKIIEDYNNPNNSVVKLNNYENEGFVLLNLYETPNSNNINYSFFYDPQSINIGIGCKFDIFYAPYIPLWMLKMLTFKDDRFATDDYTGTSFPAVAVGSNLGKVTGNIIFWISTLATLALDWVLIRGAVIDLREVQEARGKVSGENNINYPSEVDRELYTIFQDNDRQYGNLEVSKYYQVGVLFTSDVLSNNNNGDSLYKIRVDNLGVSQSSTLFGGDIFINKYYFKCSRNLSYQVANVFQNELNLYTYDTMNNGGQIVLTPAITVLGTPIPSIAVMTPNLLAVPGSVAAASGPLVDLEGRFLGTPLWPIDTDSELGISGFRTVEIRNEFVYDPLYPAEFKSDTDGFQSGKFGTQMRGSNSIWLESQINCDYRHRPLSWIESKAKLQGENNFTNTPDYDNARLGVPYYPKDSLQWCFEVSPEYGTSNGYDQRYSSENATQVYTTPRIIPFDTNQFRYRVIYSESVYDVTNTRGKLQKSELSDKYRIFFPRNYQDISKDKGQITNIFVYSDNFYVHTEKSLFACFVNPLVQTQVPNQSSLILAKAGVFEQLPKEIVTTSGGFAGCINKWASVSSPNGHTFVDLNNRKVFNLTDGLAEISVIGLKNWFYQEFNDMLDTSLKTYDNLSINNVNNPANPFGIGLNAFYDPLCNRYVLSIKKRPDDVVVENILGEESVQTTLNSNNISVSFSYNEQCWVSYHDYCSAISETNNQWVYSFCNSINSIGVGTINQMMIHNRYIGDQSFQVYSLYGLYYKQLPVLPTEPPSFNIVDISPFSVKFVVNQDFTKTKVFDNIVVHGQTVIENRAYQQPIVHYNDFFNFITCYNEYCHSGLVRIVTHPVIGNGSNINDYGALQANAKQYNNQWNVTLPMSNIKLKELDVSVERWTDTDIYEAPATNLGRFELFEGRPRLKGKYLIIELTHNNRTDFYNNITQETQGLTKAIYNLHFFVALVTTKFRENYR